MAQQDVLVCADEGDGGAQPPLRKIIHVDMDAFYASVEQRDHPSLRSKPVAVGGMRERGVVAAASYEARKFGVRSAMASAAARRRCAELIFVKPRFEVYRAVSDQVRAIFADYTPHIEPLSLDEAYLDVTDDLCGIGSATGIAKAIRARIKAETGLTASAGVSYNKFIAKLASDQNKPDGLCVITPDRAPAFVASLPVSRFHGVGPVRARRMEALGIRTGADLRACNLAFLERHFGKSAGYYYHAARGIDHRPVRAHRERKSLGSETTFFRDLSGVDQLRGGLMPLVEKVARHMQARQIRGRTVTLKLRYADFRTFTRARTLPIAVNAEAEIGEIAWELLTGMQPLEQGVRLLGVTLSGLGDEDVEPPQPVLASRSSWR